MGYFSFSENYSSKGGYRTRYSAFSLSSARKKLLRGDSSNIITFWISSYCIFAIFIIVFQSARPKHSDQKAEKPGQKSKKFD